MIKEDVLQYLKDSGYLLQVDGNVIITNKFIRDVGARAITAKNGNSKQPTRNTSSTVDITKEDYKQFIADAEVPTMISTGNSKFFANRYSDAGFKAFKDALADHDRLLLLAATKYYYKQNTVARVMIGNFFKEGIYESFVDDIKKAMKARDAKTTVLGQPTDYPAEGVFNMPSIDDSSSNMEQG